MLKFLKLIPTLVLGDIIYLISFFIKKEDNLWVFGSWYGEKYADNSKYLFEFINENHPEIRAVWLTKSEKSVRLIQKKGYEVYFLNSFKALNLTFKASVGVFSTGIYDLIPFALGNMKLVNLWHGTPLKKIWFDNDKIVQPRKLKFSAKLGYRLFPFLKKDFSADNIYIAPSEEVRDKIASAFKVPKSRVKITGYPRNDSFFLKDKEKKKFLQNLKINNSSIGIYMPTHRDKSKSIILDNLGYVDSQLKEIDTILLVKLHFHELNSVPILNFDNIIFLNDDDIDQDIYPLLPFTEFLITDYSSIYFDYLLLDKPIIFAPFDLKEYKKEDRGLYYNYETVTPGPKGKNWVETINLISSIFEKDNYSNKRLKCKKIFNKYGVDCNSERVLNEILTEINDSN